MGGHHDRLFRKFFSQPENAAGLFRAILPAADAAAIDWAAVAPVSGDFFDDRLTARAVDLLFTTRTVAGRTQAVYLLIEHKSFRDPAAAERLQSDALLVHRRHAALHPDRPEAVVIPLLVYHGRRRWQPGVDRRRRRGDPDPPVLYPYRLWGQVLFLDVSRLDEAAVRALPMAASGRLALLYLQFVRGRPSRAIEASLRRWHDLLREVHARDPRAVGGALSSYVLLATEMPELRLGRLLRELIGPKIEENVMSTAEKLIRRGRREGHELGKAEGHEQGKAEGHVEGREQGQADLLLRQLARRFGPLSAEVEARVRAGRGPDLLRWADAVLTARSLDEVLGG